MLHALRLVGFVVLLGMSLVAQGPLRVSAPAAVQVSLSATDPNSFSGSCSPGTSACNVVLTEVLSINTQYTLGGSSQVPAQSAGILVFAGIEMPGTGQVIPQIQGAISIDLVNPILPPQLLLDSLNNPFGPRFVFSQGSPASTPLDLSFGLEFFALSAGGAGAPLFAGPVSLVLHVLAEDVMNPGSFVASPPARFQVISPETGGTFSPTLNTSPAGSEPSGNPGEIVMITGSNFLAQSEWPLFPPTVTFQLTSSGVPIPGATTDSPNVIVVDANTLAVEVPPLPLATPPVSCSARVTYTNNAFIVPAPVETTSFELFRYTQTGLMPTVSSVDVATGDPEGGEMRTLFGTFFTEELMVVITPDSGATPAVEVPALPGAVSVDPSVANGTQVLFVMPPLCTGDYQLSIRNCDDVLTPTSIPYTVGPMIPIADPMASLPAVTLDAALGGQMAVRFVDGTMATVGGADFVHDQSPVTAINPAPLIPGTSTPANGPSQVFIDFDDDGSFADETALPLVFGAGSRTALPFTAVVPTTPPADPGMGFFPLLGEHQLRVENPPCVAPQSGAPFYAQRSPSNPVPVIVASPTAPSVSSVDPGIVSVRGGIEVVIEGSDFFTTLDPASGAPFQDFSGFAPTPGLPITQLAVGDIEVPAVGFTFMPTNLTIFSPRVVFEGPGRLVAEIPNIPSPVMGQLCGPNFQVRVFNPDGQVSTQMATLVFAPPLTDFADANWHVDLVDVSAPATVNRVLDEAALQQFAAQTYTFDRLVALDYCSPLTPACANALPQGVPGNTVAMADRAPAVVFARNPTPMRDRDEDPFRLEIENRLGVTLSYDYVFVFNTRRPGPPPPPGQDQGLLREFNFDRIEIPEVIQIGGSARFGEFPVSLLDTEVQAVPAPVVSPAPVFARVIIKACGFTWDASRGISIPLRTRGAMAQNPNSGLVVQQPDGNWPLVLQSRNEAVIGGIIDLSGDALVPLVSPPEINTRVNRGVPSAGGGVGGRGGCYFTESASNNIAPPNVGANATQLSGERGGLPTPWIYAPAMPMAPTVPTGLQPLGDNGNGTAPLGLGGGGGAGGGYATPGTGGMNSAGSGGNPASVWGNTTVLGSVDPPGITVSCATSPGFTPPIDELIYGNDPCSYSFTTEALSSGLLHGGFGGGGGGGGLAIIVPALTLGGRGGNAGGALVLISDKVVTFESSALLLARGEQGEGGLDAFPIIGQDPIFPINPPGAGGGGTGGTVYIAALADVEFAWNEANVPNGAVMPAMPYPGLPVSTSDPLIPYIDVRGGEGGARGTTGGVNQADGGDGGDGRIRITINGQSPALPGMGGFESELSGIFLNTGLNGGPPLIAPAPTLPATPGAQGYFGYPCQ